MSMYVAIDECYMKGDCDQPDSHFLCVVIEAYIYQSREQKKSKFTRAECLIHDTLSSMIEKVTGHDVVQGYWCHGLEQLGRKLKDHGYCTKFGEIGAVLFVDYNKITRTELQRIVDNALRIVDVNEVVDPYE